MFARPLLFLVALPWLAACGGSGGSNWAGTITDSAGIAIVHNPEEGTWGPGQAWTVQEVLSIGQTAGDADYQFGQIAGIDVDSAGNVYVADQQAKDIRVYDSTGAYVHTIGKPGSGPGEFSQGIAGVEVMGDEVYVPDIRNQRLSRFSLEGEPLGDTHIDFAQAVPVRWDEGPAGRLLAQLRHLSLTEPDAAPTGDAIRAVNADGTFGDTVAMLPAGETVTMRGGRPQVKLFSPEPVWDAAASGALVYGRNNQLRLEARDAEGRIERIITRATPPKPVTDRDKKVILDALAKAYSQQGLPAQAVQMVLGQVQFADDYPAFAGVVMGPRGSIWTQRVRSGNEIAGAEGTFDLQDLGSPDWDVFDADGKYLGVVTFPGRFQPVRIVGDRFYGVARDEMDVQTVKAYRVVTS